jgi:hypothetical protein
VRQLPHELLETFVELHFELHTRPKRKEQHFLPLHSHVRALATDLIELPKKAVSD